MPYNKESLGKYFLNGDEIFRCVAYCSHPTLTFENVKTGEQQSWADCCNVITGFKELMVINNED